MTQNKTKNKVKAAPKAQKTVSKTAKVDAVFAHIKEKTKIDPKKVDAWQKEWLSVPANRKKYEKITDTPEVVGQELVAMTNDIIDFVQGQEGGKSHFFAKMKGFGQSFSKNPMKFLQEKAEAVSDEAEKLLVKKPTAKAPKKPAQK